MKGQEARELDLTKLWNQYNRKNLAQAEAPRHFCVNFLINKAAQLMPEPRFLAYRYGDLYVSEEREKRSPVLIILRAHTKLTPFPPLLEFYTWNPLLYMWGEELPSNRGRKLPDCSEYGSCMRMRTKVSSFAHSGDPQACWHNAAMRHLKAPASRCMQQNFSFLVNAIQDVTLHTSHVTRCILLSPIQGTKTQRVELKIILQWIQVFESQDCCICLIILCFLATTVLCFREAPAAKNVKVIFNHWVK